MAMVKSALVQALFTAWKKDFKNGLTSAKPEWKAIATEIKSTTKSNTYGWLGKFPMLREWIGDRVINSMKEHGYTITNKSFESTVGVDVTDIEDDEIGIYQPIFEEMGSSAEIHIDQLIYGLLSIGDSTLCYDGQNFFDVDHPVYPKVDGTGSAKTVSNLDVPGSNPGPAWYLLDTSRAIKPLIYQNRKPAELVAMDDLKDEAVFTKNEIRFGVDCRRNVGFSFWQLAFMSKQTLNADNLWKAISAMRDFEADGGQKLGIKPTMLVVPAGLEKAATRLLEREIDNNSTNELRGRLKLVVGDYL